MHVIEQGHLQKMRTAAMQGLPLPAPDPLTRQQRRMRARGDDGFFELQDGPSADHSPSEDQPAQPEEAEEPDEEAPQPPTPDDTHATRTCTRAQIQSDLPQ